MTRGAFWLALVLCLNGLTGSACRNMAEPVDEDRRLMQLMNKRQYEQVIAGIDDLSTYRQARPEMILLRAEATFGMAGFDVVTLADAFDALKDIDKIEKLLGEERSVTTAPSPSRSSVPSVSGAIRDLVREQMSVLKTLSRFVGYTKILAKIPPTNGVVMRLVSDSLAIASRVTPDSGKVYARARAFSALVHSVMVVSLVRDIIKPMTGRELSPDLICDMDATSLASGYVGISSHLSGVVSEVAEIYRVKGSGRKSDARLSELQDRLRRLLPGAPGEADASDRLRQALATLQYAGCQA